MKLTFDQYDSLTALVYPAQHILAGFAEACFEQNSPSELCNFQAAPADKADMDAWLITESQWRIGQRQALEHACWMFREEMIRDHEIAREIRADRKAGNEQ
tara:strand:- start:2114 stop:2416 length:303 start_codon:yes stop_codon:yes gene_type:complete